MMQRKLETGSERGAPKRFGGVALFLCERFCACQRGLAAIEFAFVLPILVLTFFGVVESSGALMKSRMVTKAANTLSDLASQEVQLTPAAVDDLFSGVEQIIGDDGDAAAIRLVSLVVEDDDVVVHWSRDNTGGEPYAQGAAFNGLDDEDQVDPRASLIVVEVEFTYEPTLTRFVIPSLDFDRVSTRWPRRTMRIQLCDNGVCTS